MRIVLVQRRARDTQGALSAKPHREVSGCPTAALVSCPAGPMASNSESWNALRALPEAFGSFPTLTIVALALRISDELRARLPDLQMLAML